MKYSIGILATVSLFAAFALTGCDSPSNKMESAETSVIEANRDLEIAKSEVEAELQIYRAENEDRIIEFNRSISDIKQEIENESDDEVREEFKEKLGDLEASSRELQREMNSYKASGKENWDDFQNSFSNRMDELGDSLNDFFSPREITSSTRN